MKGIFPSTKTKKSRVPGLGRLDYFAFSWKVFLVMAFILASETQLFAPPPPPPPPNIPIDGGIGWLVAAGIALGAKKMHVFGRKKNKE